MLCVLGTSLGLSAAIFFKIDREARSKILQDTSFAAQEIDDYLNDLLRNLNCIARIPGLGELPEEMQQRVLTALSRHNRAYEYLAIMTPDGRVMAERQHAKSSCNAGKSEVFRLALQTESDSFGTVKFSPEGKFIFIDIALPLRDGADKLAAILFARLNLKFLWFVVSGIETGRNGSAYIIDHRNVLIASKQSVAEQSLSVIGGNILEHQDYTRIFRNPEGEWLLCGVAKLTSLPWRIVLDLPLTEAYKPVQQLFVVMLASVFAALAGGLGLSLIFAKRIVVPLEKLTETAGRISAGDLSVRAPALGEDELGLFGRTFNLMMDHLRDRQDALRESERNLGITMNSIGDAVLATNVEGRVVRMNPVAEKLTGWPLSEAAGRRVDEILKLVNAKSGERLDNPVDRVRRTGLLAGLDNHCVLISRNGKEYQIADSAAPIIDADNTMCGVVLVFRDISEQHQTQQQLMQAQKMETVGLLAGGLAHDFNNVLGGISGAISMIKHLHKGPNPNFEEIKKLTAIIEKSITRATRLVQQLLTLSRRQEMTLLPLDLNSSIEHISALCASTFPSSVTIKTIPWEKPAMVKADAGQIEQLLLNLCMNASHAMTIMRPETLEQGGILSIGVERHTVRNNIKADARSPFGYWVLRVEDSGVGISQEYLQLIFDPFFTTKKKEHGSGLGLVMVYNIARAHGGFVDVSSTPGKGSIFKVFLPAIEDNESHEALGGVKNEEIPNGSGLVLLADDEEIMRDTGAEILKNCGYDVILAEDGEEALDLFKKNQDKIRLVILDLVMPHLSGRDVFFEIRRQSPDVKVLLMSGIRKDSRIQEVLRAGANGFIQKPYSMTDLARKVGHILSS